MFFLFCPSQSPPLPFVNKCDSGCCMPIEASPALRSLGTIMFFVWGMMLLLLTQPKWCLPSLGNSPPLLKSTFHLQSKKPQHNWEDMFLLLLGTVLLACVLNVLNTLDIQNEISTRNEWNSFWLWSLHGHYHRVWSGDNDHQVIQCLFLLLKDM